MNSKRIGILCTGDEIIEGRVLNTNGQTFSMLFMEHGMEPGSQATVSDNEKDIEAGLRWLLQHNDCVITCGGLGPTSDDITRIAVAHVANQKLVLNEANWQAIQSRLTQFNIPVHPSNRQQAFYPEGATLIDNGFGTAAGFYLTIEDKPVFVLPGPPHECMPMLEQFVVPTLEKLHFKQVGHVYFARLIGVSEADIASKIDDLLQGQDVETAFCWQYPYCDIFIKMKDASKKHEIPQLLDGLLAPYIVSKEKKSASVLLRDFMVLNQVPVHFQDDCTGGLLVATLFSPRAMSFINGKHAKVSVHIKGLDKWLKDESSGGETSFTIEIIINGKTILETRNLPYRGDRVRLFVVEYASFCLLKHLRNLRAIDQ